MMLDLALEFVLSSFEALQVHFEPLFQRVPFELENASLPFEFAFQEL
jgi:hypothetical protein